MTKRSQGPRTRPTPLLRHLPKLADHATVSSLRLLGYRSHRIETSVGQTHVLKAQGRGPLPPVVILHGLSAAGHNYQAIMRRIRPHVRGLIAPDMPGHGYSHLPSEGLDHATLGRGLNETLDHILEEPALIFGHSLGAAAALRYASASPQNVLGLVLAAPGGAPLQEMPLSDYVDRFMLEDHGSALTFVDRLFHRPHPMRHVIAWGVRQQFGRRGIDDLLRDARAEDLLQPAELRDLNVPIRVLWGDADEVLVPSQRLFFERHLPGHAELLRVPQYGHVPHMSHPDCLAARIVDLATALHGAPDLTTEADPKPRLSDTPEW